MNKSNIAVFLIVFFLVFGFVNYFIYTSGLNLLLLFAPPGITSVYNAVFIFLVFSYPVARILGKWLPMKVADTLAFIGGLWFAAMLYFTLAIVAIHFIGFVLQFINSVREFLDQNYKLVATFVFLFSVISVSVLILVGYVNAMSPRIKKITIEITNKHTKPEKLHIVFASDIHLGHVIGKGFLKKILNMINGLQPDLVLFPGDLVDEELKPVVDKNLGEMFTMLNPKYGVFAVTGNHEYIGGVSNAVNYLSQFGIRFLRDEVLKIDNQFYIAGREDVSSSTFKGKERIALKEILNACDKHLPVILMDHQPIALNEAAENNIDLQISGHTHHGQLWPLQFITKRVFKLSWGFTKIKNSNFYVSSGVGSWGPRVRIGNRPEVVSIEMQFRS